MTPSSLLADVAGQVRALADDRNRYAVGFAASPKELSVALRLRYEVFNLELREGLESSHATGQDEDSFDAVCDHLIVTEQATGRVVGTYCMQTGDQDH